MFNKEHNETLMKKFIPKQGKKTDENTNNKRLQTQHENDTLINTFMLYMHLSKAG